MKKERYFDIIVFNYKNNIKKGVSLMNIISYPLIYKKAVGYD